MTQSKKSRNGTTSTERSLTPEQICAIIKESAAARVTELQYGELKLTFKVDAKEIEREPEGAGEVSSAPLVSKTPEMQLEELREEARLADPVLYERLMEISDDQEND